MLFGCLGALALSLVLGFADFFLVYSGKYPAFSPTTAYYKDGGSTTHIGLGYWLHRSHSLDGTRGPVITFWFFPVPISGIYYVDRWQPGTPWVG
jgi:hypothetical protein